MIRLDPDKHAMCTGLFLYPTHRAPEAYRVPIVPLKDFAYIWEVTVGVEVE